MVCWPWAATPQAPSGEVPASMALVVAATTAVMACSPLAATASARPAASASLRRAGVAIPDLVVMEFSLLAAMALARATAVDTGFLQLGARGTTGRLEDWLGYSTATLPSPAICRKVAGRSK